MFAWDEGRNPLEEMLFLFSNGLLSESMVLEQLEIDLFAFYHTVLLVLKVTLAESFPRTTIKYS